MLHKSVLQSDVQKCQAKKCCTKAPYKNVPEEYHHRMSAKGVCEERKVSTVGVPNKVWLLVFAYMCAFGLVCFILFLSVSETQHVDRVCDEPAVV